VEPTDSGTRQTADRWISVEIQTDRSTGAKAVALLKGILNVASGDTSVAGPGTRIVLLDRKGRTPIHTQDWGDDHQGALAAKKTFEDDLRSLDVQAFCEKYYIDWRPATEDEADG
jgi:hypothetical protein